MNLYLPKQEGVYPLILWVHGGSFVAGDKRGIEQWDVKLAAQGYVVAAMNYEWAPEAAYPAQLIQIKEALESAGTPETAAAAGNRERNTVFQGYCGVFGKIFPGLTGLTFPICFLTILLKRALPIDG